MPWARRPHWSAIRAQRALATAPTGRDRKPEDAGHGFLSRIAAELGEHLGYRVIDRSIDRDRSPTRIPRWIDRVRLLAEIPGTQVIGLQAARGAPLQDVAAWCANGIERNVTILVPSPPAHYLVSLPSEHRTRPGALELPESGPWDPAFIAAFRWSVESSAEHAVAPAPVRILTFLELPRRETRGGRSPRHGILSEEDFLKWRVLPAQGEQVGTEALVAELTAARKTAGSKPTTKAGVPDEARLTALRDEIVRRNLTLASWCAHRRQNGRRSLTFADLFQEAVLGLIRAMDGYDATRGATFKTYAVIWARQRISRAIEGKDEFIRLPTSIDHDRKLQLRARLGVDSLDRLPKSIRAGLRDERDGVATVNAAGLRELRDHITLGLGSLERREAMVLAHRFGLCGRPEKTLEQLGIKLHLTRERVRQIETVALERLAFSLSKIWQDGQVV